MDRKEHKTLEHIARERGKYEVEAYSFIFESLDHLLNKMDERRHVSGAELSHGIRELALERFGFMAKTILNEWGVHKTDDFGEMVYHLIKEGVMSKTEDDRQKDFNDIYDFATAFDGEYVPAPHKNEDEDPTKDR